MEVRLVESGSVRLRKSHILQLIKLRYSQTDSRPRYSWPNAIIRTLNADLTLSSSIQVAGTFGSGEAPTILQSQYRM